MKIEMKNLYAKNFIFGFKFNIHKACLKKLEMRTQPY